MRLFNKSALVGAIAFGSMAVSSAAVADEHNIVYADENWLVMKEAAGVDGPFCSFEHRSHELSVVVAVHGVPAKERAPMFFIFASVPEKFGSSVVSMGDTKMPTPSGISDLLTDNGWADLEFEYLSDIEDDKTARLVSQSLIGRFRAGQTLKIGEFEFELGSGEAAFSDANLKSCFEGRITRSHATRLGLSLETAKLQPLEVEVCDLVAFASETAIGAQIQYYQDTDTLTAVLISQHQYDDGRATYVDRMYCEDGVSSNCVGATVDGIGSDSLSYWKTEMTRNESVVEVVTNSFSDGTLSAASLDRDGYYKDTYMIDSCTKKQLSSAN
ncbi:hypothetical protein [Ruegeria arenilitoris]|uniref:hypothetical protein n=1 Tax=Ruegeria arenilitoris TaxID=1173585 RepID=UPI0014807237|nr:hypothetical protein [Ruegeria arenilitoris]